MHLILWSLTSLHSSTQKFNHFFQFALSTEAESDDDNIIIDEVELIIFDDNKDNIIENDHVDPEDDT